MFFQCHVKVSYEYLAIATNKWGFFSHPRWNFTITFFLLFYLINWAWRWGIDSMCGGKQVKLLQDILSSSLLVFHSNVILLRSFFLSKPGSDLKDALDSHPSISFPPNIHWSKLKCCFFIVGFGQDPNLVVFKSGPPWYLY